MSNYRYVAKEFKPLHKQKLLRNISVFDIETTSWIDDTRETDDDTVNSYHDRFIKPFLLVYYDGEQTIPYMGEECVSLFLKDFLTFKNRNTICFAHNGGKFDILAIYQAYMNDPYFYENYSYQPILQGSRIMSFKIFDSHRHRWEFRDSFSLLPRSLSSLCKSFKPDHVKLEMPDNDFYADPQAWVKYCSNDCISLYEILQKFNDTIMDIQGCIGYTIASTALLTFRYRFMKQNYETYHVFNDFFRQSYYGGRTEIFCMHAHDSDKPFYLYDINSLYPYVMYNNCFPISRPKKMIYRNLDEINNKTGIMLAEIIAPSDLDIPILPFHRQDGRLIFPLGHWKGMYEFSLIRKALSYGYHVKPLRAWEFDDAPIFHDFVDHFYTLKNQSRGAEKEIYKLLLNSLYGKWGERSRRNVIITDPDTHLEGLLPFDTVFGYAIKTYHQDSAYHLPVISIKVTALAQLELYKLFEKIINLGGHIYYCDTDSVITDIRLPTSQQLGDIKLETTFEEGVFLMPKVYYLRLYDNDQKPGFCSDFEKNNFSLNSDNVKIETNGIGRLSTNPMDSVKIRIKGFTNYIHPYLLDIDIWKKALYKGDYTAFTEQKIRPASLNEIRIRHLQGFVTLVENKNIKHSYDKRTILKDFNTKPLVI